MRSTGGVRSSPARPATLALAAVLVGTLGCQNGKKLHDADDPAPPNPATARRDSGPGISLDVGAAPDATESACAEEIHQTGLVPVDVLLLIDRGYGTDTPIGTTGLSRWILLREVLLDFLRDPRSAGLNVGLQFMPWVGEKPTCTVDADCPGSLAGPVKNCLPEKVCTGPLPYTCGEAAGATGPDDCGPGRRCRIGQCSLTGRDCFDFSKNCDSGRPNDLCQPRKRVCRGYSGSCDYEKYEKLAVDFSALPDSAAVLSERLLLTSPAGLPNIGPAVAGSLKVLIARLADPAFAGHRAALVLITDGLPTITCLPPSATLTADLMADALANKPSISSYVLGVLGDEDTRNAKLLPGWQEMAAKGGTKEPYLVKPDADFLAKFQSTLDEIRGRALPCEFNIPAMSSGPLDYGKVNLKYKSDAGEELVPYVGKAQACDAAKGGWYYDVDPNAEAGAKPTRVVACETTCKRFKTDAKASVDLRYGCKTRGIE